MNLFDGGVGKLARRFVLLRVLLGQRADLVDLFAAQDAFFLKFVHQVRHEIFCHQVNGSSLLIAFAHVKPPKIRGYPQK